MKRRDFLQHLLRYGCKFVREDGEHSIWANPANNRQSSIPRHREIPHFTALRMCKQLEIPSPTD